MSITPRFCALMLTALLIPAAASAEDTTRPNAAAAPSTTGSPVQDQPELRAPIGHRQPRAADIPADTWNAEDAWLNGINRDIDKRLKICRDC